ncbi:hypothetical protein BSKO_10299 [Bryopsis sp. KO-2023]|nr:hypothetical protein BSKO_10299 [Bryopsis sp. KO-2023]
MLPAKRHCSRFVQRGYQILNSTNSNALRDASSQHRIPMFGILGNQESPLMTQASSATSVPNVDAVIASQRLAAVQLELQKELSAIKNTPHGVSRDVVDRIIQFLEFSEIQFTPQQAAALTAINTPLTVSVAPAAPPIAPSPHESIAQPRMDPQAVQLRLNSLSQAVRTQSRRLRRSHKTLSQSTLVLLCQLLETAERQPKVGNAMKRDFTPRDLFAVKLNNQIVRQGHNARQKILALGDNAWRTEKSKAVLTSLINDYDHLLVMNRSRLDHINIATMLMKVMQTGGTCGWSLNILPTHNQFIGKLLSQGSKCFHQLDPGAAAYVIWSMGKLGKRIRSVTAARLDITKVVGMCVGRLREGVDWLSPRQLEACLRGLALLQHTRCREVLGPVVKRLDERTQEFTIEQVLSLYWAVVKLGGRCTQELERFVMSDILKFDEVSPQHISLLTWCLAKVGSSSVGQCLPQIVETVSSRRDQFGPLYSGKVLWALSLFAYHPGDEFILWVGQLMSSHGTRISPEIIGVSLNSFVNLNTLPEGFEKAMKHHFIAMNDRYEVPDICDMLWCLSIMGKLDQSLLDMARKRLQDIPFEILEQRNIVKMAQVLILLRQIPPPNLTVGNLLAPEVEERCLLVWKGIQERKQLFSEVASALTLLESMGYATEEKVLLEEIPMLVSTATKQPENGAEGGGDKYVVDLLFLTHKHGITGMEITVPAKYRWRYQVLESLGFGKICVDVEDWGKLSTDEEKKEYLALNTYPHGTTPRIQSVKTQAKDSTDSGGGATTTTTTGTAHTRTFESRDIAEKPDDKDNVWEKEGDWDGVHGMHGDDGEDQDQDQNDQDDDAYDTTTDEDVSY